MQKTSIFGQAGGISQKRELLPTSIPERFLMRMTFSRGLQESQMGTEQKTVQWSGQKEMHGTTMRVHLSCVAFVSWMRLLFFL